MKRSILAATAAIVALSAFVSVNAAREAADREAVEKPLKMYLSGEPAQLKQAFHPGATMFFARNDSTSGARPSSIERWRYPIPASAFFEEYIHDPLRLVSPSFRRSGSCFNMRAMSGPNGVAALTVQFGSFIGVRLPVSGLSRAKTPPIVSLSPPKT